MMRCLEFPRVAKFGSCLFGIPGRRGTKNKVSYFYRPCLDTPKIWIAYPKGWLGAHSSQHTFKKKNAMSSISDGILQFYRFYLIKLYTQLVSRRDRCMLAWKMNINMSSKDPDDNEKFWGNDI